MGKPESHTNPALGRSKGVVWKNGWHSHGFLKWGPFSTWFFARPATRTHTHTQTHVFIRMQYCWALKRLKEAEGEALVPVHIRAPPCQETATSQERLSGQLIHSRAPEKLSAKNEGPSLQITQRLHAAKTHLRVMQGRTLICRLCRWVSQAQHPSNSHMHTNRHTSLARSAGSFLAPCKTIPGTIEKGEQSDLYAVGDPLPSKTRPGLA